MAESTDLNIELELLEGELLQEEAPDPLDLIEELDGSDGPPEALLLEALDNLRGNHEQQLQGLKLFCEHRDSRAHPLVVPLLSSSCPILRMSAVYALGRNPYGAALPQLQQLFQLDSNAYVRRALAWTLGNYADAAVIPDLLRALRYDNASVRLWSAGSLVDVALAHPAQIDPVTAELLQTLQVDGAAAVRSNCAWGLGRLHPELPPERQRQLEEGLLQALLHDCDPGVRQDARSALEQLEDAELLNRLQMLVEEGLIG
ncbi:MAG: HEAT repeat domain-containing protein [Synechococcus sp.]|nr:HEAT repeat domain-containing protein [Synechococcus sp.]